MNHEDYQAIGENNAILRTVWETAHQHHKASQVGTPKDSEDI